MREVVVLGGGLHPFGRFPEKSFVDLTRPAIREALADAGVPFDAVQIAYCGRVNAPMGTGLAVVNEFGLTGIPIVNVEQACSSSSTAFRQAYWAIGQGLYDIALVVGFEKMDRGMIQLAAQDSYGVQMGQSVAPAGYARKAQTYMHRHGATPEMFAQISVKSHKNGALNPNAQYRKPVTLEEVLASRMIASPITLLQCSPTSDGASALVLASAERARRYASPDRWMTIAGWAAGTEAYEEDPGQEGDLEPTVSRLSAELYARAGIAPADIDVLQVHDAFTPGEVLRLEAMGLVPEGDGARFVAEGGADIDGPVPVNTDGGLISRGHPMGATGAAQIVEILRQLRGEAGARQVPGEPKVGVCHNSGVGGVNLHAFTK